MTKPHLNYLRYVNYEDIDDYLRLGWMVMLPNAVSHINAFGVVMIWLCDCEVPDVVKRAG